MKTLKQTRKLIAIFLVVTFLMPTINSCAKDSESTLDLTQNQNDLESFRNSLQKLNETNVDLSQILLNNQMSFRTNDYAITQQIIDDFAIEYGFEAGEISLELVNTVIEQKETIEELGLDNYIESMENSEYSKEKLISMGQGEIFEDLENDLSFQNLSTNEKNQLSVTNEYLEEVSDFDNSTFRLSNDFTPEWDTPSFIAGVFAYQILFGSASILTFGIAGVVGVLVFNIIGWASK